MGKVNLTNKHPLECVWLLYESDYDGRIHELEIYGRMDEVTQLSIARLISEYDADINSQYEATDQPLSEKEVLREIKDNSSREISIDSARRTYTIIKVQLDNQDWYDGDEEIDRSKFPEIHVGDKVYPHRGLERNIEWIGSIKLDDNSEEWIVK